MRTRGLQETSCVKKTRLVKGVHDEARVEKETRGVQEEKE